MLKKIELERPLVDSLAEEARKAFYNQNGLYILSIYKHMLNCGIYMGYLLPNAHCSFVHKNNAFRISRS